LLDYKGKPALPVREYMVEALNSVEQGEKQTVEQKAIYQLTTKLYKTNKIKLTLDEAKLVKDQVGKFYGPLVYGRICDLLEANKPESTCRKRTWQPLLSQLQHMATALIARGRY
jgi:hypothetical protein